MKETVCSSSIEKIDKVDGKLWESTVKGIESTLTELEKSLSASHSLERKRFQGELQLQIDKVSLSIELERKNYNYEKLKRIAMSLSEGSSESSERSETVEDLKRKNEQYKQLLLKREVQLKKIKKKLCRLVKDNLVLVAASEEKDNQLKKLSEDLNQKLRQQETKLCCCSELKNTYEAHILSLLDQLEEQMILNATNESMQTYVDQNLK